MHLSKPCHLELDYTAKCCTRVSNTARNDCINKESHTNIHSVLQRAWCAIPVRRNSLVSRGQGQHCSVQRGRHTKWRAQSVRATNWPYLVVIRKEYWFLWPTGRNGVDRWPMHISHFRNLPLVRHKWVIQVGRHSWHMYNYRGVRAPQWYGVPLNPDSTAPGRHSHIYMYCLLGHYPPTKNDVSSSVHQFQKNSQKREGLSNSLK